MKRNATIFFISSLAMALCGDALAYNVSQTPQKKDLLIEKFTGAACTSCVDGDNTLKLMQQSHPENLHIIGVHAGYFATPVQPDFTIPEGEELDSYLNISNYPSIWLNRHTFPARNQPAIQNGFWHVHAREAELEGAPVNLWMAAEYDAATGIMTVDVEGYFTGELNSETAYLTVAMTQSRITAPQKGAPNQAEYVHNHVLRAYLTPTWGEEVSGCRKGEYFTRQFKYAVPEIIGSQYKIELNDLEFVAFLTESKEEVLNSTACHPTFVGYHKPMEITLEHYKIPTPDNYGFDFMELYMTNNSTDPITTANFKVTLNGRPTDFRWDGRINPGYRQLIILDTNWFENEDTSGLTLYNEYTIECTEINGEPMEAWVMWGAFYMPETFSSDFILSVSTGKNMTDNSFRIKDSKGKIVREFGPFEGSKDNIIFPSYNEPFKLKYTGYYCLEMEDSWGDGFDWTKSYVRLYNIPEGSTKETLISDNPNPRRHGIRYFFKVEGEENPGFDDEDPNGEENPKGDDENPNGDEEENPNGDDEENPNGDDEDNGLDYIYLPGDAQISVYDLTGIRVYTGDKASFSSTALTPGLYVIRSGSTVTKIVLR